MGIPASRLRRRLAIAIGLPAHHVDVVSDQHHGELRVLSCPSLHRAPSPGRLRAGPHTDDDCFTIPRSQDAPGALQAQTRTGAWIEVPVVPGAFVVNVGDLLMRWTDDRWISTMHRVVNPPNDHVGEANGATLRT
jgi:isopenicillin N synthase-like dioxygenase